MTPFRRRRAPREDAPAAPRHEHRLLPSRLAGFARRGTPSRRRRAPREDAPAAPRHEHRLLPSRLAGTLPRFALSFLLAVAAAGCALEGDRGSPAPGAARIAGHVVADRLPPDATVEVYRNDGGTAVPLVGTTARPDRLGRFETAALVPGRYFVVLRTREAPPSIASADVPARVDVELRLASPGPGATITLVSPGTAPHTRTCVLAPASTRDAVPDRREVSIAPGREVRVAGLAPGTWHVDVLPDGATADIVVPEGENVPAFLIDPPDATGLGGALEGVVVRGRGDAAVGSAVTARPCAPDGSKIDAWGRFGRVDRDGRYVIERVPKGTAFIRVEARDVRFNVIPTAELIEISPSATATRGFVVEP